MPRRSPPGVLLVLVAITAACSAGAASSDSGVLTALCAARDAEGIEATRDVFYSRAHADLHDLADALTAEDRAAAGQLLVAKNQVEAALDEGLPGPLVDARLDDLIAVTRTAAEHLARPAGDC